MRKQMLRKWLQEAAIAAGVFTGQPYWQAFAEAAPAAQQPVRKPEPDAVFAPVLRAAD